MLFHISDDRWIKTPKKVLNIHTQVVLYFNLMNQYRLYPAFSIFTQRKSNTALPGLVHSPQVKMPWPWMCSKGKFLARSVKMSFSESLTDQRIYCHKTSATWNYLPKYKIAWLSSQKFWYGERHLYYLQCYYLPVGALFLNMIIEVKQFYSFCICQLLLIGYLNNGNRLLVVQYQTVLSL